MRLLLIDNYDSFTHMLADYVRQCGADCVVIRNDDDRLELTDCVDSFEALVLSPGPEIPNKAGLMMRVIREHYQTKPMLGVCLGHQAIGEFFGAKLVKAVVPRHGKVDEVIHNGHILFDTVPQSFMVTRYHSLILDDVKLPLQVTAATPDNETMALSHKQLPLYGIQFHPESCLTEYGLTIIKNYIEIVKQHLS